MAEHVMSPSPSPWRSTEQAIQCPAHCTGLSKGRALGLSSGLLKVQSILTPVPPRGLRGPVSGPAQPWVWEGLPSDLPDRCPEEAVNHSLACWDTPESRQSTSVCSGG